MTGIDVEVLKEETIGHFTVSLEEVTSCNSDDYTTLYVWSAIEQDTIEFQDEIEHFEEFVEMLKGGEPTVNTYIKVVNGYFDCVFHDWEDEEYQYEWEFKIFDMTIKIDKEKAKEVIGKRYNSYYNMNKEKIDNIHLRLL